MGFWMPKASSPTLPTVEAPTSAPILESTCDESLHLAGVNQECGGILACCQEGCACETHGEYTQCVAIGSPNSLTCIVEPQTKYLADQGYVFGSTGSNWMHASTVLTSFFLLVAVFIGFSTALRAWRRRGFPLAYGTLVQHVEPETSGTGQ